MTKPVSAAKMAYRKKRKENARQAKVEKTREWELEFERALRTEFGLVYSDEYKDGVVASGLDGIAGIHIEIRPVPGKGIGAFATQPIENGVEIYQEYPLIKGANEWLEEEATFSILPELTKQKYLALHGYCRCKETPCKEAAYFKIWNTNSFDCSTLHGRMDNNVYEVTSRLNHDCLPNCRHRITAGGDLVLYTIKDIKQGEELTMDYLQAVGTAASRRAELAKDYGFECQCLSCTNNVTLSPRICSYTDSDSLTAPRIGLRTAANIKGEMAVKEWIQEYEDFFLNLVIASLDQLISGKAVAGGSISREMVDLVVTFSREAIRQYLVRNNKFGVDEFVIEGLLDRVEEFVRGEADLIEEGRSVLQE